jgi:hypothetical protein
MKPVTDVGQNAVISEERSAGRAVFPLSYNKSSKMAYVSQMVYMRRFHF